MESMNNWLRIVIEVHLIMNAFMCGWQWNALKPKKFNNKIMWIACIVLFMLTFNLIYFGELAWLHLYDFFRIRRTEIRRHDGEVYMIRWSFTPFIKVHKFVRSDDSCHHDHPWWFISMVLRGHYYDVTEVPPLSECHLPTTRSKKKSAGQIMFRKALHAHRVELDWYIDRNGMNYKPCWTLVINGRDQREWGFMTRTGWIEWKKFFNRDKSQNICK